MCIIDIAGRDPNGYVEEAARLLKDKVKLPPGYAISWSGQYEAAQRVKQRLLLVVPLTLFLIFLLLYMNTRSITKTMLIILAVPFSAVGAIWFLYLLGYNMSIAVWVGLIALLGGGCGNGHLHAPVSRPGLRPGEGRRAAQTLRPIARRHHRRRGQAYPAQVHDRGHPAPGADSHHVGHRGPAPTS